jgi:hypothetical protein
MSRFNFLLGASQRLDTRNRKRYVERGGLSVTKVFFNAVRRQKGFRRIDKSHHYFSVVFLNGARLLVFGLVVLVKSCGGQCSRLGWLVRLGPGGNTNYN